MSWVFKNKQTSNLYSTLWSDQIRTYRHNKGIFVRLIPQFQIIQTQSWHYVCQLPFYSSTLHTFSFDWFLSGLEWILNLGFCLLKRLIFYQKLLWNIRLRLNSSTFWVFEPVFRYVWSKLKLFAQKMKIFIKYI